MSIIDQVVVAVSPPETDQARLEARSRAEMVAAPGDWLDQILRHHRGLEDAFDEVKGTHYPANRRRALRKLAILLMGHAIAEEAVIYPALAMHSDRSRAGLGYDEQAWVKIQMAMLERLEPMTAEFIERLEQVEQAVARHMVAEEGSWLPDLKRKASSADQAWLTERYMDEYERYIGVVAADR